MNLNPLLNDIARNNPFPSIIAGVTSLKQTSYASVRGMIALPDGPNVSLESQFGLFSCTKSMTAMAALILVEQGKLRFLDAAKKYVPRLQDFYIVDESDIDDAGEIVGLPRMPRTDITVEQLFLHTAGFAYVFTHVAYARIHTKKKQTSADPLGAFVPSLMPLVHEPGTQWTYGSSTDWLGLVVEAASGQSLSQFLQTHVFDKAGMALTLFVIDDPAPVVKVHVENHRGEWRPRKRPLVPYRSKVDMGGHGCFSTLPDFLRFLRIWLNYGLSPDTGERILQRETVEHAICNHLALDIRCDVFMGLAPDCPSPKSEGFSYAGCAVNRNELPSGRPADCLYWGGLANLFFWIDFKKNCAGFFGCQMLPFKEPRCEAAYRRFETETYRQLGRLQLRL